MPSWNLSKVCQYIKTQTALAVCDLKTVSHRLEILLCLTTGHWEQNIKCLHLDCSKVFNDKKILLNPKQLKNALPGHNLPPLEPKTFKDTKLCVLAYSKQCRTLTKTIQNCDDKQLLLSFVKPH